MTEFTKERFPELVHSCDHRKKCQNKVKERLRANHQNHRQKQEGREMSSKKELARAAVIGKEQERDISRQKKDGKTDERLRG